MNKVCVKNIMSRFSVLVLSIVILGLSVINVHATGTETTESVQEETEMLSLSDPLIVVDHYEITDEKIVPGEDFTLKIVLKNYNMKQPAKGVLIDIDNPSGVAPVYGTVSQMYIGDIGAGESKEISIDYNSWTTVTSDTLDFNVTIVTDTNQNYVVLRIPVGSDSPFSVLSVTAPPSVQLNELVTVSVTFKVLGEERVKDVVLVANSGETRIGSSQIGILTPGITKTQQLLLSFNDLGEHTIDIALEYADESGQKQSASVVTTVITALARTIEDVPGQTPGNDVGNDGMETILLMGISGMLILVIFLVVIIVLRKNK